MTFPTGSQDEDIEIVTAPRPVVAQQPTKSARPAPKAKTPLKKKPTKAATPATATQTPKNKPSAVRFSFGFRAVTPQQIKAGYTPQSCPPKLSALTRPAPQPIPLPAEPEDLTVVEITSPPKPAVAAVPKQKKIHAFFGGSAPSDPPKPKETAKKKRQRAPAAAKPTSKKQKRTRQEGSGRLALEVLEDSSDEESDLTSQDGAVVSTDEVFDLGQVLTKGRRKSTGSVAEAAAGFAVKDQECVVDFEIASFDYFSVTQVGQKKQKKKTKQRRQTVGLAPTAATAKAISTRLQQILMLVAGRVVDPETKRILLPLVKHGEVTKVLRKCGVVVKPVPKTIMTVFLKLHDEKKQKDRATVDLSGIPADLLQSLYPFQRRGVVFALRKQGRVLLGDEMGLGKTIQGIAISSCYRAEWPLLVICPSSVRTAWSDEYVKWLGICPLDIRVVMTAKEDVNGLINIVSYDLVHRMIPELEKKAFQMIIADESHYLKNNSAKRTNAIVPLLKSAKRVLLLSGTPALSRPEEVFTQLDALRPDIFASKKGFEVFASRYCNAHKGAWGWDTSGASHLTELHCLLSETVMIRRKKLEVLQDLPTKQRHTVNIDVEIGQPLVDGLTELRQLEKTIHQFQNSARASTARKEKQVLTALMYVETAQSKRRGVQGYLLSVLQQSEPTEKFIVFAHHQQMMDAIEEVIHKKKLGFIRIDGSTKGSLRQSLVNQFQSRDSCRIALLSVTAGGTGITLNAASSVIFAELYWTPAILQQAEDRAHRIGQKRDVNIYYLLGNGTLDDAIWPLVSKKLDIVGKTIDGVRNTVMGATPLEAPSSSLVPLELEEMYSQVPEPARSPSFVEEIGEFSGSFHEDGDVYYLDDEAGDDIEEVATPPQQGAPPVTFNWHTSRSRHIMPKPIDLSEAYCIASDSSEEEFLVANAKHKSPTKPIRLQCFSDSEDEN